MTAGRTIGCLLIVALHLLGLQDGRAFAETREYKGKLDEMGPFHLRDLEGGSWTETDLQGRVLIVVLWAGWCGPCLDEFPQVQKLHDVLGNRGAVTMVSLNLDEDPAGLGDFFRRFRDEYSFPVLLAWPRYKFRALPATWIVDRDGYIREVLLGSGPGWIEMVRDLARRVGESPPVSTIPRDVREAQRTRNVKEAADAR